LGAYANSFLGPFVFDDLPSIASNQSIRNLSTSLSPDHGMSQSVEGRPVLNVSLALNFAAGRTDVRGYHAANLLIHFLAALVLYGLVRRTFLMPALAPRYGGDSRPLAALIALLWALHPLQTESVTYVFQRAESLMGLFFLGTLYGFVRSLDGALQGVWRSLCIASFLLGLGTKEVAVAALPLLILYDAIFVSGGFTKAWRAHWGLFVALSLGVLGFALSLIAHGGNRSGSAGFGIGVSPVAYALTQPRAILTYLKLSFFPDPLVFEYGAFWERPSPMFFACAAAIVVLLALSAWALKCRPAAGFIAAWFFLILAPTSLVPGNSQMIVEHRMYLPLAAVVVLAVLGLHALLGRRSFSILLAIAAVLGWLTSQRNKTYRTEIALWSDTVAKRPGNARAHHNLGSALKAVPGRASEAIVQYREALRLDPDKAETHFNLGVALEEVPGGLQDAIDHFQAAVRLKPDFAEAHRELGKALVRLPGRVEDAVAEYTEAIRLRPGSAEMRNNLGIILDRVAGRTADAVAQYQAALRLSPRVAEIHVNLGNALAKLPGRLEEAIAQYDEALRLDPGNAEAHNGLGAALAKLPSRRDEAIAQYKAALELRPDDAEAHNNLGAILQGTPGRLAEAVSEYEAALRLKPDMASVHLNLAVALLGIPGRNPEAVDHLRAALRLDPGNATARQILSQVEGHAP
jgi:tetratricopeptide (TPR) repeat protein